LGAAEILALDRVAATAGVAPTPRTRSVIRLLGARELGHGVAILSSPTLVWNRVAGDVLDIALLAVGQRHRRGSRVRGLVSALGLTVIGAVDVAAARRHLSSV
jgi:hypothetical protein